MLIKRLRGWEIPEREATPESIFLQRRALLKGIGAGTALLASGTSSLRPCFCSR